MYFAPIPVTQLATLLIISSIPNRLNAMPSAHCAADTAHQSSPAGLSDVPGARAEHVPLHDMSEFIASLEAFSVRCVFPFLLLVQAHDFP